MSARLTPRTVRLASLLLPATLLVAACASTTGGGGTGGQAGGSMGGSGAASNGGAGGGGGGGTGGAAAGGSAGSGASAGSGGGGSSGSGGVGPGGAGGTASAQGGSGPAGGGAAGTAAGGTGGQTPGPADSAVAPEAPSAAGGKALMVVGTIPLVGTDQQIKAALVARGLEVEEVRETAATRAHAEGKRVVVLSYSMTSGNLKVAEFADVTAPIMVLEHNLLPGLGMTTAAGHGYTQNVTQITITSSDPTLTAGFPPGDRTVYSQGGAQVEVFWGVPGPGAVQVATVKGNAGRVTYFVYPAGAMMIDRPAPGKRMQFFFAAHAPPPLPLQALNADGLKLLQTAVDWLIAPAQ